MIERKWRIEGKCKINALSAWSVNEWANALMLSDLTLAADLTSITHLSDMYACCLQLHTFYTWRSLSWTTESLWKKYQCHRAGTEWHSWSPWTSEYTWSLSARERFLFSEQRLKSTKSNFKFTQRNFVENILWYTSSGHIIDYTYILPPNTKERTHAGFVACVKDKGGSCLAAPSPPTKRRKCSSMLPRERWRNLWNWAHKRRWTVWCEALR